MSRVGKIIRATKALSRGIEWQDGTPLPGWNERITPRGVKIIELDVEADPEKRDPRFLEEARRRQRDVREFRREYCVRANARILTAELEWKPAGHLRIGELIIGFDEDVGGYFKYQPSLVEDNRPITTQGIGVVTERGSITVSPEHQFVVRRRGQGTAHLWKAAVDLEKDDQILYFGFPWEREDTREAGWLAGMYDGEGCVSGKEVSIAQKLGPVLDKVRLELLARGFTYCEGIDKVQCVSLRVSKTYETLRLLGMIRPIRLLEKSSILWAGRSVINRTHTRYATVIGLRQLGDIPFIALQTSTNTYIAEGYLSHNCRDRTSAAGNAVYPEFNNNGGIAYYCQELPGIIRGQPIYRGWDFGLNCPPVTFVQVSPTTGRVYVLREIVHKRIHTPTMANIVRFASGQLPEGELDRHEAERVAQMRADSSIPPMPWFPPGTQFLDYSGPECFRKNADVSADAEETSSFEILAGRGIHLIAPRVSPTWRVSLIRSLLLGEAKDGGPMLIVDISCRYIIGMFLGLLSYPKPTILRPHPAKPRKDGTYDDVHDSLGYVLINVKPLIDSPAGGVYAPPEAETRLPWAEPEEYVFQPRGPSSPDIEVDE